MTPQRDHTIFSTALFGAVFVVSLDRILKVLAYQLWSYEPVFFTKYFGLVFSKNYFISFSLDPFINPLFIIIPAILLLIAGFFFFVSKRRWGGATGLWVVLLGALSNLYDRLAYGYVIDYLNLTFFTVFNLADVLITVGVGWLIWRSFRSSWQYGILMISSRNLKKQK